MNLLKTLWRIWHIRNEMTHRNPAPPTEVLGTCTKKFHHGEPVKEKMVLTDLLAPHAAALVVHSLQETGIQSPCQVGWS